MSLFALQPKTTNNKLIEKHGMFLAQLLENRAIRTDEDVRSFLNPQWSDVHDPMLLHHAKETAQRIAQAIENDERIAIYADYDADGIPGAVVLSTLFDKVGYENYEIYIPHRHDEGYGLHIQALEKLQKNKVQLVITIDVGISAHEAGMWAKDHDLDLIITDHHEPLSDEHGNEHLPNTLYLVNPKQQQCQYPDDMLCGCGVIFKVVQAFVRLYGEEYNIHEGWEKWLLDMVGFATISDMVPLQKENRVFSHFGLQVLPKTKRPGLQKMIYDAGLDRNYLTEEDIGFSLAPKINAASRMSHPQEALQVLREASTLRAHDQAKKLTTLNNERKKLVAQTMKAALKKITPREEDHHVIVAGNTDWQSGILGLVSSRISERFNKASFIWSEEQGVIKGSCRSDGMVNLVELMQACPEGTFINFGGHKEAGGFSCTKDNIHFLQETLNEAYIKVVKSTDTTQESVFVDMELDLDDIRYDTYETIRKLAPFGQGNPKPLFKFSNVVPVSIDTFGKTGTHTKILFTTSSGRTIPAITFFQTPEDYSFTPKKNVPCDVYAHIDFSVYRGKKELRLSIVDIEAS